MFAAYDDMLFELGARFDYVREAYGDRCPRHPGVLRGGGDCGECEQDRADAESLWQILEGVAGAPGSLSVTRKDRKDVMTFFMARGYKVKCVGSTVVWEVRR